MHSQTPNADPTDPARAAFRSLLAGSDPITDGADLAALADSAPLYQALSEAHAAGGTAAVRTAWGSLVKQNPTLAALVAGAAEPSQRYLLHNAAEALQPQPAIPWIVDGVLSAGSVALVYGDPGSAKTYSLLDAAVCVAQGAPWLAYNTHASPVLFVDEESGPLRMARRLGDTLRGHEGGPETAVYYTSLARFDLRKADDLGALADAVAETGARLVIVDALVDVMPGGDENAVADVHPLFLALRSLADRVGCCVVVIHHSSKAGGYRGSSAMHGAVDVMILVKKEGEQLTFDMQKNRDGEPARWAALGYWEEGRFWLVPVAPGAEKTVYPAAERYVLRYLSEHGASTTPDVAGHAEGCGEEGARRALYRLADRGLARRVDAGGPGTVATYDLTDAGKEAASANL